jgi:2-phospho-L-lactate guanylyltransferase
MGPPVRWWVTIPMKDTGLAKSRFGGLPADRRQLAIVMARDTLCAVVHAVSVEGCLVVCQNEADVQSFSFPGVTVIVCQAPGINAAIAAGVEVLRAEDGGGRRNIAVLPGDLPYLRSAELDDALAKAAGVESACVGDHAGTGTTMLTARAGHALNPAYGDGSLRRHCEAGAKELRLPVWSGLRCDVDVPQNLRVDAFLGYRTRGLMERRSIERARQADERVEVTPEETSVLRR